jgi:hypothetical protein
MHETVRVVERAFLVGADRHASHYPTPDGKTLEPQYFLALWPEIESVTAGFAREVHCLGPRVSRHEAALSRDFAKVMGLIDTNPAGVGVLGKRKAKRRLALRRRSIRPLLRSIRVGTLERSSWIRAAASSVKIWTENQWTRGDTPFPELPCEAPC